MNSIRLPEDWGILPVPRAKRTLRPWDLGVLWGDLAVSLLVMVAGSLLVPGLSTKEALAVIALGTLLGTVLLSLAGVVASNTGVPTMVTLRPSFGVRGSYAPSALNIVQLVGWAALEIIIMAQAAGAMTEHYLDFRGYYLWLTFFGLLGMLMAIGGPVLVVREFMQKFGVWVVVAASTWLTFYLFYAYDMGAIWDRPGQGGFPNFWQGVDLVIALPASWLPLVGDYARFARDTRGGAIGTYIGYAIANIWFFTLGMFYVQALETDPGAFIGALVGMMLPLTAGWLALVVLLVGETDEAFANIYSTAVSAQNTLSKVPHWLLAVIVGAIAILVAIILDLIAYETFLFLIGGVFVPVFGILLADYFIVRALRYPTEDLYSRQGAFWFVAGVNPIGLLVWAFGFLIYAHAAQPPWLLEHADFVSWAPAWMTHIGGTIPAFVVAFVIYGLAGQLQVGTRAASVPGRNAGASAGGGGV